ncbi:MAG: DNRLRE domain-containing protein [Chloroflexi bacterium]|nr:DNRLRE domain-containing protein [Chloroflexota bacterium]
MSRIVGAPGALAVAGLVLLGLAAPALAAGLSLASQNLTPYRTCTITGTPAASTAVSDASVRQASATSNFGTSATNNVATGNGANRRLYIRFDLSLCSPTIPSTATVRLATLRIYITAVPASCRTVDVFRVTTSWVESTLTWNNQPFGTTINNPANTSASDTYTIGSPAGCQNLATGAYAVGAVVTTDVALFVAGTATNFGWMLRDDVEGSSTTYTQTYSAKDLGTVGQAPQLVVTYVTAP